MAAVFSYIRTLLLRYVVRYHRIVSHVSRSIRLSPSCIAHIHYLDWLWICCRQAFHLLYSLLRYKSTTNRSIVEFEHICCNTASDLSGLYGTESTHSSDCLETSEHIRFLLYSFFFFSTFWFGSVW